MHIHAYTHVNICTYAHIHVCMYAGMHVCARMHVPTYKRFLHPLIFTSVEVLCRCRDGESTVYHVYVRERGQFYFHSVFLRSTTLTLEKLTQLIRQKFISLNYVPNWTQVRPVVLLSPKDMNLNVYRIYPAGSTQQEGLYGNAWFQNNTQMKEYLGDHPCPKLEVVFV